MRGNQRPGLLHLPDGSDAYVDDALDLLGEWGFEYDVAQLFVMSSALAELPDGRWAAKEVGVEVPRQNGKGELLEGRECLGLFYLDERKLIHSAHEYATASEALDRMEDRIGRNPKLKLRLRKNGIKRAHGEQGVYLKDGRSLQYKTRTKGGGRGFSADLLILDEAMYIAEAFLGALMPVISARPNPQMWYTGSAVDQETMDNGVVFARLRQRALEHRPGRMAYFGWSAAYENGRVLWDRPSDVPDDAADSPLMVARANPALGPRSDGGRIDIEHVLETERAAMSHETFCVERLGVGDWPDTDAGASSVIDAEDWARCADGASEPVNPVCFAACVTPNRDQAAVALAGVRADGLFHIGVLKHAEGTKWVPQFIADQVAARGAISVVCQGGSSPSATLVAPLANLGIGVTPVNSSDLARASGFLYDAVDQETLRHLGTADLKAAVRGAAKRTLTDGWAWSQTLSDVDISTLVACTLALGGLVDAGALSGGFEW